MCGRVVRSELTEENRSTTFSIDRAREAYSDSSSKVSLGPSSRPKRPKMRGSGGRQSRCCFCRLRWPVNELRGSGEDRDEQEENNKFSVRGQQKRCGNDSTDLDRVHLILLVACQPGSKLLKSRPRIDQDCSWKPKV